MITPARAFHQPRRYGETASRRPPAAGASAFGLLLFACLPFLSLAQGAERSGDSAFVGAYQHHARTAVAVENELLFQIGIASDEERLVLYWTYDHLAGTWLQVELLREQVALAIEADSVDEEEARATLRDQAQFALWDLAQSEMDLERSVPELRRPDHLRINQAIRALLVEIRPAIRRLLFDQCARLFCAPGP